MTIIFLWFLLYHKTSNIGHFPSCMLPYSQNESSLFLILQGVCLISFPEKSLNTHIILPFLALPSLWTNVWQNHKKQNIFSNFFFWDKVRVKSISLEQRYDVQKCLFQQGQTQYLVFRYRIYLDSFRPKCLMWIWKNGFVEILDMNHAA